MQFEDGGVVGRIAEILGFVVAYCVFTSMFFLIFFLLHKLPETWTVFPVALVTLVITLASLGLKRWLA